MGKYTENSLQGSPQKSDTFSPPLLDTLAQLDSRLQKRAKSKFFTQKVSSELAGLESPLRQHYWNAWHCNEVLQQTGDKLTAKYCNSRICNVCNRIRTAKMINGYMPVLKELGQPQFVTLTVPNVEGIHLKRTIEIMQNRFKRITLLFKYRKMKYAGIRKLEGTYNAIANTFHPHYHVVTDSLEVAEEIVSMWLGYFPEAASWCQDVRPVDKNSMQELFKYTTKVVAKDINGVQAIHLNAIDTIMRATWRKRIIQPFGGIRKNVSEDVEELASERYIGIPEYDSIEWTWYKQDWVNPYGELLTGYEPSESLAKLAIHK